MALYALGYTFEAKPGVLSTGVSYRGSPTMNEDEAKGIIFGIILKECPSAKVLNIAAIEVLASDLAQAVTWSAARTDGDQP